MDRQYQQPKCAHHIQLGILSSCERNWYNYSTVFQKSNTFPGVYRTIQTKPMRDDQHFGHRNNCTTGVQHIMEEVRCHRQNVWNYAIVVKVKVSPR